MTDPEQIRTSSQLWAYIADRILDSMDTVVSKVTSGSFLTTVAIVGTYCWIAQHLVKAIPPEKITSDFVFGFVGGGFATAVMFVLKAYFDKSQRKDENDAKDPVKPGA